MDSVPQHLRDAYLDRPHPPSAGVDELVRIMLSRERPDVLETWAPSHRKQFRRKSAPDVKSHGVPRKRDFDPYAEPEEPEIKSPKPAVPEVKSHGVPRKRDFDPYAEPEEPEVAAQRQAEDPESAFAAAAAAAEAEAEAEAAVVVDESPEPVPPEPVQPEPVRKMPPLWDRLLRL